jgi:hypothetical protein
MKQYQVTLKGISPLLLHADNLPFSEKIKAWNKAPENKALSIAGDDRTPAWTWIGCLYHDGNVLGVHADCVMSTLREGGKKVKTGHGKETFKKHTQSGLFIDQQQFKLLVNGKLIEIEDIKQYIGENDFNKHLDLAESLGFELLVKRAKIGTNKHVRVRPMFRNWEAVGSITVMDEELSGLTEENLQLVFDYAGALCGIGDWRPNSPSSGSFGKFEAELD